jgi:hypothetical protein
MRPALTYGYGSFVSLDPQNRSRFLQYIPEIFTDTLARRYVKGVIPEQSYSGGSIDDAFCTALADSARKYHFEITLDYMNQGGHSGSWSWAGSGMPFVSDLPRMLNVLGATNLMLYYHANFETFLSISMVYDTMPNGDLNDPRRAQNRLYTEQFYILRHLYGHLHPGATYVLNASSSTPDVRQVTLYDTTNDKSTVLLVNTASSSRTTAIDCGSYDHGTYQAFRLSADEIDVRLSPVTSLTGIELPARSATFLTNGYVAGDPVLTAPHPFVPRVATQHAPSPRAFTLDGRYVPTLGGAAGLTAPREASGVRIVVPAADPPLSGSTIR